MLRNALFTALLGALACGPALAQSDSDRAADALISQDLRQDASTGYFSQHWLDDMMEKRTSESIRDVPRVYFDYYVIPEGQNRLQARLALYRQYGNRDVVKPLLWILNGNDLEDLHPGDTLVVPSAFDLDFRAYSPFPRYYPGARDLEKIVILNKTVQSWAAYRFGELQRWGPINTGAESGRTPSGRFNVNWKQDYRVSTLSPGYGSSRPDAELWEMYWVMNLHERRGIHMHQYALPTAGPASHGCIRLLEPDAKWLYTWTDTWDKTGGDLISSSGATIHDQGTMVLIIGSDISEKAQPFIHRADYPVIRMVDLPPDPYAVPAGTDQQETFDRKRSSSAP